MNQSAFVWLLLALMLLAANLPYISNRVLLVGPKLNPKPFAWRALELLLLAALSLAAGMLFEWHLGQRHPQGWEFYAAVLCLFVTLGFPGFVWRYLRRGRYED
ncbi:MAG: DUF2818 domain-containing protein [Methylibium sp.]|nr:DUF2818 domain-containing protein [Methylibium sp.]